MGFGDFEESEVFRYVGSRDLEGLVISGLGSGSLGSLYLGPSPTDWWPLWNDGLEYGARTRQWTGTSVPVHA